MVEGGKHGIHILSQIVQGHGEHHQNSDVGEGRDGGAGNQEKAGQRQGHAPQPQGESPQSVEAQSPEGVEDAPARIHSVHRLGVRLAGQAQEDQAGQGVHKHQNQVERRQDQQGDHPPGGVDAEAPDAEGHLVFQGVVLILLGEHHVHPQDDQIDTRGQAEQQGGDGKGHIDRVDAAGLGFDQIQAEDDPHRKEGAQNGGDPEIGPVNHFIALGLDGAQHQNPSFPAAWWPPMRERK